MDFFKVLRQLLLMNSFASGIPYPILAGIFISIFLNIPSIKSALHFNGYPTAIYEISNRHMNSSQDLIHTIESNFYLHI